MTPPQARPVSIERPLAGTAVAAAVGAEGPFVINLRSSTTPMALSQPNDPALARFKFFMSRRLEDGRERFRLHMGFFETLAEAEEWLAVVREIYPGAWAGEAPGKRLKARGPEPAGSASAAAATAAVGAPASDARTAADSRMNDSGRARRAAAGAAAPAAMPSRAPAPPAAPRAATPIPASAIPRNVPVLQPAPAQTASRAVGAAPMREPRRPAPQPPPAVAAQSPSAGVRGAANGTPSPASGAKPIASQSLSSSSGAKQKAAAVRLPLSNVREVLAALDETGATRQMPALPLEKTSPPMTKPAHAGEKPAHAAEKFAHVAQRPAHVATDASLSDTQVLKLLEGRRADGTPAEVDRGISLLKPDDTGTRRALKEAVTSNAPVSFAVQLQWSVQSIDIAKVPPLAIFSAYTLYTVEGSREGRRWYGLRLGFFSDAISAKQVAQYVRSEFNSVAVVPVSPQERGRASEGSEGTVAAPKPPRSPLRDRLPEPTAEFKLIDDEPSERRAPAAAHTDADAATTPGARPTSTAIRTPTARAAATSQSPSKPKGAGGATTAKRGPRTPAGRVRARDRRSPQTLEETLEILGADQLEIDQGRGETLNDTGVRHLSVQVRKNSPFTRLLDRLSERARGR